MTKLKIPHCTALLQVYEAGNYFVLDFNFNFLVLDPRFKLEFFKKSGWDDQKVSRAKNHVKNAWLGHFKPIDSRLEKDTSVADNVVSMLWAQFDNVRENVLFSSILD